MLGSLDGAELCELIDIYIQSILAKITSKNGLGLYRDNSLKNKDQKEHS